MLSIVACAIVLYMVVGTIYNLSVHDAREFPDMIPHGSVIHALFLGIGLTISRLLGHSGAPFRGEYNTVRDDDDHYR